MGKMNLKRYVLTFLRKQSRHQYIVYTCPMHIHPFTTQTRTHFDPSFQWTHVCTTACMFTPTHTGISMFCLRTRQGPGYSNFSTRAQIDPSRQCTHVCTTVCTFTHSHKYRDKEASMYCTHAPWTHTHMHACRRTCCCCCWGYDCIMGGCSRQSGGTVGGGTGIEMGIG